MTLYGYDISNHDWDRHPVSLADAKKAGISLVTHKATEGNWYRDPRFDDYVRQLGKVSFPVAGSYHVLNHGINVTAQTDYWINYVVSTFPGWAKHPCWIWQIDAEPLDGYAAPTKAEILACGQRLVSRLKVDPASIIVYGPDWAYGDKLIGLPFKLWSSNYVSGGGGFKGLYPGDKASRWNAYSGQTPTILQYSSSATIGAQRTCDANAIRVSNTAALQQLFRTSRTPQIEEFTVDAEAKAAFAAIAASQAAINRQLAALPKAVWSVPFVNPNDKKTSYTAASWLVSGNVKAGQALAAATAAGKAAAIDAAAVAADIKTRLLALLGGTQ